MRVIHSLNIYKVFFVLFVFALVNSSTALAANTSEEPSEFLLFLGRFHPLFVHLPIGFLIIAFLLECFSRLQRFREVRHATSLVLLLGTLSAIAAALLGYFLSFEGGYDEEALFWHQWFGIGVAVTAAIAYFLKLRSEGKTTVTSKIYFPTLALSMVALTAAGHLGGNLTHGSDYLTMYMPGPLRTIAGLPPRTKTVAKKITNINEAIVYTDIIHPIFEGQCISCHNPDKKKGDLLMHTFGDLMKGGENGKVLTVGNAAKSDMYKRLLLPVEDEDHMPPKGKKQLTKAQIELIRWWIDEGASPDKKVAQVKVTEPVKIALTKLGDSPEDESKPRGIFAKKVPQAAASNIAAVKKAGFSVMPIAQDNHYVQVKYLNGANPFGTGQAKALHTLAPQVTWLDLSNTNISNEGLKELNKLTNLTRLRMDHTNITDISLEAIQKLDNLEYLNVYGTAITDTGLQQLALLKNLKSLYLWQTKVSVTGVKALQQKLPKLVMNTGWIEKDTLLSKTAKDSQIRVVNDKK